MKTVTLCISSREDLNKRAIDAFDGKQQDVRISFSSVDLLWETMTRERWRILKALTGQRGLTPAEIARRTGMDLEQANQDIRALVLAGLLDRDQAGHVTLPYDSVHVDFEMTRTTEHAAA